jgi:hypothetical protein
MHLNDAAGWLSGLRISNSRSRRSRLLAVALVTASAALLITGAAWAYAQTYASNTTFHPGGIALSSIYSGTLASNLIEWDSNGDTGDVTYCVPGGSCDSYMASSSGLTWDTTRTITGGRAKCHSADFNPYDMHVIECRTST